MDRQLRDVFARYTKRARAELRRPAGQPGSGPLSSTVEDHTAELRALVDELEQEATFQELVGRTRAAFSGDYHHDADPGWDMGVAYFFRRSRYYLDAFRGRPPESGVAFDRYVGAFERRNISVTYLAPLEGVRFATDRFDFGKFQIQRFAARELATLVQNDVNAVFWPAAYFNVQRLADHWLLCASETVRAPRLGVMHIRLTMPTLGRTYTTHPAPVESALEAMALFNWQPERHILGPPPTEAKEQELERRGQPWFGFGIPFVLRIDDNLLDYPKPGPGLTARAPDISSLVTRVVDPRTGEHLAETYEVHFTFDERETSCFDSFVRRAADLLASLGPKKKRPEFLNIALGTLLRAFFAEGPDQLLGHITALEALIGDAGAGMSDRMARRVGRILGRRKAETKAIRRRSKQLYDLRSRLVHGDSLSGTYPGRLGEARELVRRVALWFVHCLADVQAKAADGEATDSVPRRGDILSVLDMDEAARSRVRWLIDALPTHFPRVSQWLG